MNEVTLAIFTIFLVVAVDVLGITLIIPVFATYAKYLGAPDSLVGLQFTVFSGAAIISSLYVGRLSDRFGRRIVFLYAACGASIAFTGSACAQTFTQFLITSTLGGLFTGTVGNAYAYVSDILPEELRTQYLSYITAVISSCFVIGPFVGGALALFNIRAPFFAAASMASMEILFVYLFIAEPSKLRRASMQCLKDPSSVIASAEVREPVMAARMGSSPVGYTPLLDSDCSQGQESPEKEHHSHGESEGGWIERYPRRHRHRKRWASTGGIVTTNRYGVVTTSFGLRGPHPWKSAKEEESIGTILQRTFSLQDETTAFEREMFASQLQYEALHKSSLNCSGIADGDKGCSVEGDSSRTSTSAHSIKQVTRPFQAEHRRRYSDSSILSMASPGVVASRGSTNGGRSGELFLHGDGSDGAADYDDDAGSRSFSRSQGTRSKDHSRGCNSCLDDVREGSSSSLWDDRRALMDSARAGAPTDYDQYRDCSVVSRISYSENSGGNTTARDVSAALQGSPRRVNLDEEEGDVIPSSSELKGEKWDKNKNHLKGLMREDGLLRRQQQQQLKQQRRMVVSGQSPWLHMGAMVVGGCGTFLNVSTFTGIVSLVPFVLMDDRYGLVSSGSDSGDNDNDNGDDSDISAADNRAVSLVVGCLIGWYGMVLVISMMLLFPPINRRSGLVLTGAIGSIVFGLAYCVIIVCDNLYELFAVFTALAVGNSLCRPMFPAYLASVAPAGRNAEYMAVTATFSNLGIMVASELTVVYAINATAALLVAGGASVLNAAVLSAFFTASKLCSSGESMDSDSDNGDNGDDSIGGGSEAADTKLLSELRDRPLNEYDLNRVGDSEDAV